MKDIVFEINASKESYIYQYFVEAEVGVSPERLQVLLENVQAKRKQYGLKHHVLSKIHEGIGDTLTSVATEISPNNSNFTIWDKGKTIVIMSRTKYARYNIFVGDKNDNLAELKSLPTGKKMDRLYGICVAADHNQFE